MALTLTTPAFGNGQEIPSQYTCEGVDDSPEVRWSGAPANTKSFALIVDDPDAPDPKAPKMTWVHWVVYDLPASTSSLPEKTKQAPAGAHDGLNDWKKAGWNGPCPPIGRHRYYFKLYALDAVLGDRGRITKAQLEQAMAGHILEQAETMGTYHKKG
jgi:Raf kinase inhibitor-like YbhB/YbcL family protein